MQYIQRIYLFLLFILSFFFAVELPAQTLNLNYFGIEDGLPQSGVSAMTQDHAGNLWIGTMAGAAKYNGLNFESFSKRDGLAENRITACYTDRMGNIWFGHWTGGISKYNPRTKKFYEVKTGNLEIFRTINSILEDSQGNMLFGTNGQGLLKYTPSAGEKDSTSLLDSTNGKFILITAKEGLSSNVVHAMAEDKHQLVWVGTSQGITKMDIKGNSDKYSLAVINGLPADKFTSILIDSKQNLWLGTEDKGVFRSSIKDPRNFRNYSVNDGMSSNHIKVIFEDINGNIFIGSTDAGMSKYLPDLERNKYDGPIFQIISTSQGLSNDRINCIIQDREKNIWIGTALYLNQYFDEQFEIFGPLEGLKNSLIWSIIQDRKGNYWLGELCR
jgi:ligand-binding sensor domain-containing protein